MDKIKIQYTDKMKLKKKSLFTKKENKFFLYKLKFTLI